MMQDEEYIKMKMAEANVLKKVTPTHTRLVYQMGLVYYIDTWYYTYL